MKKKEDWEKIERFFEIAEHCEYSKPIKLPLSLPRCTYPKNRGVCHISHCPILKKEKEKCKWFDEARNVCNIDGLHCVLEENIDCSDYEEVERD